MLKAHKKIAKTRKRRVFRTRKNLKGTNEKPRLSVHKSNKHLFVQMIDDESGKTIAAVGTNSKDVKMKKSKQSAEKLGEIIASIAKEKKINKIVFDRGRFKYHGLIQLLADSARKAGLEF